MFSVKWLFWKELGFASAGSGVLVLANTLLGGSGLLGMPAALAQAGEDGKNTQLQNLKWDVRWQSQWYPEYEEPFLLSLTRMSFCMKSFLFVALSPCHIQKMLCDRFDWCRKKLTSFFELFGTLEHRGPRKLEDSCNIRRFGIVWVGMFEVFLLMLSVLSVFWASFCSFLRRFLLLLRQATRWGWFSWRSSAVALRSDVTCCSALHEGQVLERGDAIDKALTKPWNPVGFLKRWARIGQAPCSFYTAWCWDWRHLNATTNLLFVLLKKQTTPYQDAGANLRKAAIDADIDNDDNYALVILQGI